MTIPSRTGVTTGVTAGPRHAARPPGRRSRKTALAGLALGSVGMSLFVAPGAASAAPLPVFPDNIVIFPDRDMVVLEDDFGSGPQDVRIEVVRNGQVIGATHGRTATGGEFEVNHPGGACWGWGTNGQADSSLPQVTPDIKPGDVVRVLNSAGSLLADTTVQDGYVEGVQYTAGATTFTVTGHVATGIDLNNTEQRIVNPDLTDTDVARRDIRAVPGGLTAAPKGGYLSDLARQGETFTATYEFTGAQAVDNARTAATGGGERFMAWEQTDGAANRQGLTISEFGEFGGPGMGGCPAGPGSAPVTAGTYSSVFSGTSAQVNWSAATAQPDAAPVTGYSIEAVKKTPEANGETLVVAVRAGTTATRTTLANLTGGAAAWDIEVRAIMGTKISEPFRANAGTPTDPGGGGTPPPEDTTPPAAATVSRNAAGEIVVSANEPNVDVYYTTDGSDPLDTEIGLPTQTATLYTAPIKDMPGATNFRFVSFDLAGNHTSGTGSVPAYQAPAATIPAPPGTVSTVVADKRVTVNWTAPGTTGGAPLTGYKVTATAAGSSTPTVQDVTAPAGGGAIPTTAVFSGLTNGTVYTFTVAAVNSVGESPTLSATATPGDGLTGSLTRNKARDVRFAGSSLVVGQTVTVAQVNANGTLTTLGSTTTVAGVAPVVAEWELRLRPNNALPAGTRIRVYTGTATAMQTVVNLTI